MGQSVLDKPDDNDAKKPSAAPLRRPRGFSRKAFDDVCDLIANGMRVTQACNLDGMPSVPQLYKWLGEADIAKEGSAYFGLDKIFTRAMLCRSQHIEDEILDIVDDSRRDTTTRVDRNGDEYEVPDHEWLGRSRLRFEARKWLVSKLAPKKYGDSATVRATATASEDGNKLEIVITHAPDSF